eukprot:CAMPEP_0182556594 /NCGR_PEP_ID=MMETSP1324-20130603/806_1 /TAXON_ID=236786 /ORGANISM="Florenciella sp., Strain RCC1587" /LENGTH=1013 /DNA_ID=CAMNT_0024768507 /DNA_START=30 /DNA_END=3071 /DNA_ORIENTATION=-
MPGAQYKYAGVKSDDVEGGQPARTSSGPGGDDPAPQRMPYFVGTCVLLAIVYVLSRTGAPAGCSTVPGAVPDGFDIDAYREERLAATPPNIIECAEASEGESQEACHLPQDHRYQALSQKGITLWMTGYSGSGKSTIARALEEKLVLEYGLHVQNLDGDNVRTGLNRDLGFSPGDRAESVRRVGEMACLFTGGGVITLVTLVSPYQADRDAARQRHEEQGLKFMEVFMDVPIEVVQERDPKGLYAKVKTGEIKSFTGMSKDAPYEPPPNPEINLPNYKMTVEESVDMLITELRKAGVLSGGPTNPMGLPMPSGFAGEFLEDELMVKPSEHAKKLAEAATLPKALITDIDVNWLQVIGEGWAAPLKGFMREGPLLQTIHFNSLLIDPFNVTGATAINEMETNWNDYWTRARERVSISVPIVLPITGYTKAAIEGSGKKAVSLVDKDGRTLAILRNPEIYENRKEEIVTRCFGAIDMGHPYISHIYSGGDYLLGGEIELLQKITYNDGLDQYRLTPKQMYAEYEAKGADVVFAFQTRNPTHAGHAYLMRTGRERLIAKGYKNPVLWLSPLGGWTKSDDVPLDVRVKQHVAILEEKMLDPAWTVMAIWPAPMIYGGPTEVQFHAQSRRNAGASFFVVGRDAAGMKGSMEAVTHTDDDIYNANHARYVLQMSPVLEDKEMSLVSFDKFYYDKTDHEMKAMDDSRPDDFISISGSKMRALAAQHATPCPDPIPSDLLAANCIPPNFMVQTGWDIVCDYYADPEGKYLPWSKPIVDPLMADNTMAIGQFGDLSFELTFTEGGRSVSPWHDLTLRPAGYSVSPEEVNFVVEIPMFQTAKMEVNKELPYNPITQDKNKDGSPRYYTYGTPFFNYGLLPQTWEDPALCHNGACGDNDPLDVMEIGSSPLPMGAVVPVKVLGSLELIDEGETDHKIIAIRVDDPDAYRINDMSSLEYAKPGITEKLIDWLKMYKTSDGKGVNELAQEYPTTKTEAIGIIEECHQRWQALRSGGSNTHGFYLGR